MKNQTITLSVKDGTTFIEGRMESVVYKGLKKALGYQDDKAMWKTKRGANGKPKGDWDGWQTTVCYNKKYCKCAIKKDGTHFPTGLLSKAREYFKSAEQPYVLVDSRTKVKRKTLPLSMTSEFEPRDYQKKIIDDACERERGIIKMATGGGKCRSKDSCLLTDQGMITFEELGNGIESHQYGSRQATVASPLTDSRREFATEVYHDGWGGSRRCLTRKGFVSTATPDHQIKVLTEDGIVWKKTSDLEVGDYAVMAKNQQLFGNSEDLCLDDAYWIGLITGDGVWTENSSIRNTIKFTNEDKHLLKTWSSFGERHGLNARVCKHSTSLSTKECTITNKEFCKNTMLKWVEPASALEKTIPLSIRQSEKSRVKMFIRGLFETDGWCCYEKSKPTVCIAFSSKALVDQLHVMLLNFGIVAHRRIKKTTHADSHILTIYRDYIPKFIQEIGFDSDGHKFVKLNDMMKKIENVSVNTNSDIIPNQSENIRKLRYFITRILGFRYGKEHLEENCDVTYSALRSWSGEGSWRNPSRKSLRIYCEYVLKSIEENAFHTFTSDCKALAEHLLSLCRDDLFYDEIVSIENDYTDNYDFVVPDTHSYVANGFINHNTATASGIIAELGVKPFIFYVTSIDLLRQAKSELEKFIVDSGKNLEVGMIGNGKCDIKDINIMTVQTAVKSLGQRYKTYDEEDSGKEKALAKNDKKDVHDLIHECGGMICDEVQHWAAKTCQIIADHSENARFRFGLSATPWRDEGDDLLIDACFGKVIADINASFLIDRGVLVQPTIYFVHMPRVNSEGSYATVYQDSIVQNEQRNMTIANVASKMVQDGRQVLILCKQIDHGEILESMIDDSSFINGTLTGKKRSEWIQKMKDRDAPVTIATSIFDEGVDVKPLDGLILAGSGKSQTRALQRVGRVIRSFTCPYTGTAKKDAFVVDFHDNTKYMKSHSMKRRHIYKTEPKFIIKDWNK